MIRTLRRFLGFALFAWAGWQLWRSWVARPVLVGVTPWGEPTGLRVTPLDPLEAAAAAAREIESAGLAPAKEADCGCA